MHIICWWRHLFPTFSSAFKHVRSLFPLDESLWCALIVKGSPSSSVYLSSGEVSTLICEVMFALRGGWTMHLLPQLRVRSSAADLSVKSKHSKKHVHTSTMIPFNCIILQCNTGLFMHSMGLKKQHLLDYTVFTVYLKNGTAMMSRCVRTHLQISAVTSLLSEILKIYTAAEKTRNLFV